MDENKLLTSKRPASVNRVVLANLDEALVFAEKNNRNRFFSSNELRSLCYKGLMAAARNFDPAWGRRFLSYAKTYVRGEIRHEVHRRRVVRKSETLDIDQALSEDQTPTVSMDWDALHNKERREIIAAVLHRLTPRERQVIETTFFGGNNISEAAVILGVARQAAHQTLHRALEKLRRFLESHKTELE